MLYDGNELFLRETFNEKKDRIDSLIIAAKRASQENAIDPMEKAICLVNGNKQSEIETGRKLIKAYPLSTDLLAMTNVWENVSDNAIFVSAKGAPEAIFQLCRLDEKETAKHLRAVQKMAGQGYRVIAVAEAPAPVGDLPEKQTGFEFQFLGLIALEDPIRPEVPQAVKECSEAGIKVIMITGDYPATAKSIALQIGLDAQQGVTTGDEIDLMNDDELRERIKHINVFARVVPEQKLRIVHALKANNEIVAMTGDGVNDAPALKAADIGIAMGNKGTDVAREASSIVLLDDNFASIVSAIRSGRRIFDNLQKAMSYIMSIHIPIIGLTMLPVFFPSLPLLLMPLHIVFMELIIDPVCSIAFESEQEESGIMSRPPRDPNEQFFGRRKILLSLLSGCLLLAMVIIVYVISVHEGHSEGAVRAIAFISLILGNVFLALTDLSKTRSFFSVFTEKNLPAIIILIIAMIMLVLVVSVPALQRIFSFQFPGYKHFVPPLIGATVVLAILEGTKYFNIKRVVRK